MDKRIVIAAAGAGKTYYIANDFENNERVILISFTNANVNNISKEVKKRFDNKVPNNIKIMTFDSFVYNNLIRPVEPLIHLKSNTGIDIKTTPIEDSRKPGYINKDNISHYMNERNEYYVTRIGKLFLNCDKNIQQIISDRLERYCDAIYFDEFQDYNGYDFKVLKYFLEKTTLKVVAVGDINQSCLTPMRSVGNSVAKQPFFKLKKLDDLKNKMSKKILFDESTLEKSRRVPHEICEFIQEKMNITINSISEEEGSIIYLTNIEEIHNVLSNPNITKLIWNKKSSHPKINNYVNWSYSKGDTYEQSCIILTEKTSDIDNWKNISTLKTKNGLYVALTRSTSNVYLISSMAYNKWKKYVE